MVLQEQVSKVKQLFLDDFQKHKDIDADFSIENIRFTCETEDGDVEMEND